MSNKIIKQERIFKVVDSGSVLMCKPATRNKYRKSAYDGYCDGETDRPILYDSKSLSCGFVGTHLSTDQSTSSLLDEDISETVHLQRNLDSLVDFLSECLNNVEINPTNSVRIEQGTADDQCQIDDLYEKCSKLPAEWNVIQITQMYDGYNGYATKKDMYNGSGPIVLTLFRYNLAEKRNNRAFSLVPDFSDLSVKNIFATTYEINQVLYKIYSTKMNTSEYSGFIKNLTQTQAKSVADIKFALGPMIALFSGKIKGAAGKEYEQTIYDEVSNLCRNFDDFPVDNLVLLNLFARRIDLLDSERIKHAARYVARNYTEFNRISEWLAQLKCKQTSNDFQYYPCILVIDELIDQMPWEMVLPAQEFSRVHSIYLLFDLYERFKNEIHDGYYHVDVQNGMAIINPDNDEKLHDMCKRMSQFYTAYLPNWKRIEQIAPKMDEIIDGFSKSDIFVYSGHGTSLQFFNTESEFEYIKHCCVVFLFGCESNAMRPRGTICEATCSSYTFFKNGSPGILGALTIVTDIWVDLITISIITQWIILRDVQHPVIDVCKDAVAKERVNKILAKCNGRRNPSLLALLCDIRNEQDISLRMRSAMVYRGLPPYNTSIENVQRSL